MGVRSPFVGIDAPRTALWVVLAGVVTYLVLYFANYNHWFVHPHQFEIHLPLLMEGGPEFHLRDFGKIFQLFDPSENRPRFLAYAIILVNLHLRMWLYDWFVLFPPVSVGWVFELLLGPLLLYRFLVNVASDRFAALTGVLIYVTSIGFLSGFAMPLMPSKPLSNVVFIAVLYLCSEIRKRASPGQLFLEIPGCTFERRVLFAVLLGGLFLDEVPLFAFLLPLLFFPELFFPAQGGKGRIKQTLKGGIALALPALTFIVIVAGVVPRVTKWLYGYKFNLFGSVLVNDTAREAGKTFFSGPQFGFGLDSLWTNFLSLVGTSVVPAPVAPFAKHPAGGGVITGLELQYFVISAVLIFVAGLTVLALRSAVDAQRRMLVRAMFSAALFILFMSLLSGRHVPYIAGYVYGCAFPVFLAIVLSLATALLARCTAGKWLSLALALYIAIVQATNFRVVNRNWIELHNEGWTKSTYRDRLLIADNRPLTKQETSAIWKAWKDGNLEKFLTENHISSGAVFLVFELRWLEQARPSLGRS